MAFALRKSDAWLLFLAGCIILLALAANGYSAIHQKKHQQQIMNARRLVGRLGLTDLCLFTEARYTRHWSQADLHAPFQDHPLSLPHFPSESHVRPPIHLKTVSRHEVDSTAKILP